MTVFLIANRTRETYVHNCKGQSVDETYSEYTAKRFTERMDAAKYIAEHGLERNYRIRRFDSKDITKESVIDE